MIRPVPSRRHAIADDLRHQISTGHFKAGERLPSEAQLATRYTVSTPTLRSALALLQSEGLVEKVHGSGNFVRRPLHRITYLGGVAEPATWATFSSPLRVTTRTTNIEAHSHLPTLLNVPPRSPLTEVLRITHEGKMPHSLACIYAPRDLAPADSPTATPSPEQIEVSSADHRPPLAEVQERLSARLPTQEEAATLRISTSLAVLSLTRVATDATGRVVEAALLVLPGDRTDALFITRLNAEERTPNA
ncbi:GntR family transcriptional regulator [Streptomyces sp. NPDC090085]|uniref:GntR family transcriptional regulator n=1 Tax=Streptomyces sp. NPDC090085 TaxID=3365943 RepID=UPI003814B119